MRATGRAISLVVILAGVAYWAGYRRGSPSEPGAGVTRANYDRIQEGMTEAEALAVFGCPPGDYTRSPRMFAPSESGVLFRRTWLTDEADFIIYVQPDDFADLGKPWRVKGKKIEAVYRMSFGERCRLMLAGLGIPGL